VQLQLSALGLAFACAFGAIVRATASPLTAISDPALFLVAQAMVPPTGTGDADSPMAMEERMRRRFPQAVRVGFLIGLPVLDDSDRTLGYVQEVVRKPQNKIQLIVSYDGWFGWGARSVAVPVEVVGMLGRQVASLDMARSEYAAAPTWQGTDATVLASADSISVALARR
jgi:PRC-barrel domain